MAAKRGLQQRLRDEIRKRQGKQRPQPVLTGNVPWRPLGRNHAQPRRRAPGYRGDARERLEGSRGNRRRLDPPGFGGRHAGRPARSSHRVVRLWAAQRQYATARTICRPTSGSTPCTSLTNPSAIIPRFVAGIDHTLNSSCRSWTRKLSHEGNMKSLTPA